MGSQECLKICFPCHVDKYKLLGLIEQLKTYHTTVLVSLETEFGPDREGLCSTDRLLERHISARWKQLTIQCEGPALSVFLRDEPYREVAVRWSEENASESARKAFGLIKHWKRLSQFPSHFLLFMAALIATLGWALHTSKDNNTTPDTRPLMSLDEYRSNLARKYGEEEADRIIAEAQQQLSAPQGTKLERVDVGNYPGFWSQLGHRALSLAKSLLIGGVVGLIGVLVTWAITALVGPWWSRVFPAFHFEFDSCRHHYLPKTAKYLRRILIGSILLPSLPKRLW